ncbi:MAG: CapA family protein [Firmicutes bacterium]|nr:CapA family protein [Bacillota bacterium]
MRKKLSVILKVLLVLLVFLFLVYSYLPVIGLSLQDLFPFELPLHSGQEEDWQEGTGEEEIPLEGEEAKNVPPSFSQATLVAAGDIMVHQTQYLQAYNSEEDSYDFSPSFQLIAPYLQSADLAVANLETTLAGRDKGYRAYPRFNSPDEIAFALQEAGFDLLATANNHSLDSGEGGLYRTLEVIEEAGLEAFGTARSQQERDDPLLLEANEITLAFLSYTYGTNGIPLPEGKDYIVNLIDEDLMARDIARTRQEGADLVVVYMHWGQEYQFEPSEEQRRLARFLVEAGADIILGSHPHVIQPMEFIEVEGSDGDIRRGFVVYSLGNFISNQHRIEGSIPTGEVKYGLLLRFHLEKDLARGDAYLKDVDYLVTWVNRSWRHRLLPLYRVLEAEPEKYQISADTQEKLKADWTKIQQRLQGFVPAFTLSP